MGFSDCNLCVCCNLAIANSSILLIWKKVQWIKNNRPFSCEQNWQIDRLQQTQKLQSTKPFSDGCKDRITSNICQKPKLKNKWMFIFNCSLVHLFCVYAERNDIFKPHWKNWLPVCHFLYLERGLMHLLMKFGEIPNFSRQAEQADKLTYMILYFHIKIQQMCVLDISLACTIVPWFLHENTIYCMFLIWITSLLSQPTKLLNFAKLNCWVLLVSSKLLLHYIFFTNPCQFRCGDSQGW